MRKAGSQGQGGHRGAGEGGCHWQLGGLQPGNHSVGKLLKSADEATENAANDALQRLADGDSPAAARKAKSILDKKNGLTNNAPGMTTCRAGQRLRRANHHQRRATEYRRRGCMRTMSVKNVNGVKEINASEDGKTVKIKDDPAQGIKVELTEKQNGKEVTKKYEAKNVEELKKKHPAGYELYKKYIGEQPGNGVMQFRIQAGAEIFRSRPCPRIPPAASRLQPALPLQPLARRSRSAACPALWRRRATTRRLRSRPAW